jgi:ABC-2 type transport system ATP-binding protein
MQEVHAVCDRVLIIRDGRLALDSTLADLEKGRRLLLTVDRKPDIARARLTQINGVRSVQHLFTDGQLNQYGLEMNDSSIPIAEAAAPVAKALVDMDFKIYALTPEKRDLETVFSEINTSDGDNIGGQVNAA